MYVFHVSVAVTAAALAAPAGASQAGVVGDQANVALAMESVAAAKGLTFSGLSPGANDAGDRPESVGSRRSQDMPIAFGYDSDAFFETVSESIDHRGSMLLGGRTTLEIGNFTVIYDAAVGFRIIDNIDLIGLVLFDIVVNDTAIEPSSFDIWTAGKVSNQFALRLLDLGIAAEDLSGADVRDDWIQRSKQPVPGPAVGSLLAIAMIGHTRRRR